MTVIVEVSPHNLERRLGDQVSHVDTVDVGRYLDDAVGVVAREVGVDGVPRHDRCLLIARARATKQRGGYLPQLVCATVGMLSLLGLRIVAPASAGAYGMLLRL